MSESWYTSLCIASSCSQDRQLLEDMAEPFSHMCAGTYTNSTRWLLLSENDIGKLSALRLHLQWQNLDFFTGEKKLWLGRVSSDFSLLGHLAKIPHCLPSLTISNSEHLLILVVAVCWESAHRLPKIGVLLACPGKKEVVVETWEGRNNCWQEIPLG